MNRLELLAPDGVPEVRPGDDLAALLAAAVDLADGDVVVVTSKVVSKAEGRQRTGSRDQLLADETVRVVARRGETRIVRTRHGLTLAAAGIDASHVEPGTVLLLPEDPDASARRVRAALRGADPAGVNVGVVVTDTAGRAWRDGQTDIAIGAAGLVVAEDLAGRVDAYGTPLAVTRPAVADEIASAAELAQGKLAGRPFAVLRGRPDLVLPPGEDGPGAAALVRPEGADLFGLGAREAVVRALAGDPADRPAFGSPVPGGELREALARVLGDAAAAGAVEHGPDLVLGVPAERLPALRAVCFAHGWAVADQPSVAGAGPGSGMRVRVRPATP